MTFKSAILADVTFELAILVVVTAFAAILVSTTAASVNFGAPASLDPPKSPAN